MKTVLVTGGAGFIGSNLVKELLKRGYNVRVLDSLATGRKGNLEDMMDKIEFIEGDIRDREIAKKVMEGVYCVFHEAALPSVPRSVEDPLTSNDVNINGTLNMLFAAKEAGVKKFIYAGSSSAYGESETLPKVETMKPSPLSPYAVSKLTGEYYCQVFHRLYGIETVVLRYFNVYGQNQDPNSQYAAVIPKFITSILSGKSPTVYGDGEQTRDFTFVSDVVEANMLAMENSSKAAGRVMNASFGKAISINDLIALMNRILGKDVKPEYLDERPGDIKHSLADISLAKELISYYPKFSIEEGLKEAVKHYGG